MAVYGLRYRCKCGFPCYSAGQEQYHRDGACLAIRRMVSVMVARERCGHRDHTGLEVDGMRLQRTVRPRPRPRPHPTPADGYQCTCGAWKNRWNRCPVHRCAA